MRSPCSTRGEEGYSFVYVFPETGRLHQIRVHFAAIGHPLLGDPLYTGEGEIYKRMIAGKCTEADRLSLLQATRVHMSPVMLLYEPDKNALEWKALDSIGACGV